MNWLFLFVLALLIAPAGDPKIEGKWRSAAPVAEGDSPWVYDFFLEGNGNAKLNKIEYVWEPGAGMWEPVNAEMIAAGDNDNWLTENGYLTVKVREIRGVSGDIHYKIQLNGDTLRLWKAEVYHGKGEPLAGEWTYETVEEGDPKKSLSKKMLMKPDGTVAFENGNKKDDANWATEGDRLHFIWGNDTNSFHYETFPHMLGMYNPEKEIILIRRKTER